MIVQVIVDVPRGSETFRTQTHNEISNKIFKMFQKSSADCVRKDGIASPMLNSELSIFGDNFFKWLERIDFLS